MENVKFSKNTYDKDGDLVEEGVYLHFGETSVRVCEHLDKFPDFISQLQRIEKELFE